MLHSKDRLLGFVMKLLNMDSYDISYAILYMYCVSAWTMVLYLQVSFIIWKFKIVDEGRTLEVTLPRIQFLTLFHALFQESLHYGLSVQTYIISMTFILEYF